MSERWDRVRVATARLGGEGARGSSRSFGGGGGGAGAAASASASASVAAELRQASSRTVRLGRVQPQAPSHRTIYCNDREANLPVGYRVASISRIVSVFTFF